MVDKPTNGSNVSAPQNLDLMGLAQHFAQHTAMELAKVFDAMDRVRRQEIERGFKSGVVALDVLGNADIELLDSTKTVILQAQNGYLDGLTVQLGDFKFTYPNKQITVDNLHVPTFNPRMKLTGTAGTTYIVSQSSIGDLVLSDVVKGFSNISGNVTPYNSSGTELFTSTNPGEVSLTGSNVPFASTHIDFVGSMDNTGNITNGSQSVASGATYYASLSSPLLGGYTRYGLIAYVSGGPSATLTIGSGLNNIGLLSSQTSSTWVAGGSGAYSYVDNYQTALYSLSASLKNTGASALTIYFMSMFMD